MALSDKARKRLEKSMAKRSEAVEIADAIDASTARVAAAVADIPVPASATAEDCANKINALLASLRAAGLLAP